MRSEFLSMLTNFLLFPFKQCRILLFYLILQRLTLDIFFTLDIIVLSFYSSFDAFCVFRFFYCHPLSVWFFYCPSFFFPFLLSFCSSFFWLLWVSSLAYPNLLVLGAKRLGCCIFMIGKPFPLSIRWLWLKLCNNELLRACAV
jgi:hypothetical protein